MIDKDMKEDTSIARAFPDTRILYCFWHNEKTFQKNFRNETLPCALSMMLAESKEKFDENLAIFEKLGKLLFLSKLK